MEPLSNKVLLSLLSGLFGLAFPVVSLGSEPQRTSRGAVDLLVESPDSGGATFLPEKAEVLGIKPEVARQFYERTIAGSPFRDGKLNWDLLMALIKDKATGPKIIKLLPGVEVEFTPTNYEAITSHARKQAVDAKRYRWTGVVRSQGKVVGEGLFIVDENRRRITSTIQYKNKRYEIVSLKNGSTRVFELDPTRFPEEQHQKNESPNQTGTSGGYLSHDEERGERPPGEPDLPRTESIDTPCLIDVLVLYTQNAKDAWEAEGNTDFLNEMYKAMVITNQAFEHSKVNAQVRFADIKLVDYQESGSLQTDLGKLWAINSELAKQAAKWRDETGADLVSLWVAGGDWCGISPPIINRSRTEEEGFLVVQFRCAAGESSFAHEIGHNLGARHSHNDEVFFGWPDHGFNFGHLSVNDGFRTIMSYNRECNDHGVYCQRVSHFSNPDVPFPGTVTLTGVKDGPLAADNHQQLNNTACTVAAYKSPPASE